MWCEWHRDRVGKGRVVMMTSRSRMMWVDMWGFGRGLFRMEERAGGYDRAALVLWLYETSLFSGCGC